MKRLFISGLMLCLITTLFGCSSSNNDSAKNSSENDKQEVISKAENNEFIPEKYEENKLSKLRNYDTESTRQPLTIYDGRKFAWYQHKDGVIVLQGEYGFWEGEKAIEYISNNLPSYNMTSKKLNDFIKEQGHTLNEFCYLYFKLDEESREDSDDFRFYGFVTDDGKQLNLINLDDPTQTEVFTYSEHW